jgi:hypothetical protein
MVKDLTRNTNRYKVVFVTVLFPNTRMGRGNLCHKRAQRSQRWSGVFHHEICEILELRTTNAFFEQSRILDHGFARIRRTGGLVNYILEKGLHRYICCGYNGLGGYIGRYKALHVWHTIDSQ